MKDTVKPIQSESARFLVGGTRKGQGVVLLYPDKLASVSIYAELWGYFVGPLVVAAAAIPIVHIIGSFSEPHRGAASLSRGLAGRADRAGRRPGAGGQGSRRHPSVRDDHPARYGRQPETFRSTRLGGLFRGETLVVTTADGTEYGFRGRTGHLQNDIAGTLAGLGREVRATTTGLAVTPRALDGES